MSARAWRRLALAIWALYVLLGGLYLGVAAYGAALETKPDAEPFWLTAVVCLGLLVFATTGAVVAARRPDNPIGWLMCAISISWTVSGIAEVTTEIASVRPDSFPAPQVLSWLTEWTVWPALGLSGIFLLLFPDGRPLSPRWRLAVWLTALAVVLSVVGEAFHPDPLVGGYPNPIGAELAGLPEAVQIAGAALLAASMLAAIVSLLLRFRRAKGGERQQLKWLAYVVLTPIAVALPVVIVDRDLAGQVLWVTVLAALVVGAPVATALAILRYRLYDIDLIIRRTLVYGVATAALAGVYLAVVLLLQQVSSSFTGGSDLAIAISTLAAFALFRPVRGRVQALVDRRFYRRKYDAQRTLEAFAARLREHVDLRALTDELAGTIDETMRPSHVSVWLRRPPA